MIHRSYALRAVAIMIAIAVPVLSGPEELGPPENSLGRSRSAGHLARECGCADAAPAESG